MSNSTPPIDDQRSLASLWLQTAAYYLRGKGLLVVGAAVIGLGLWFNWGWMVSLGLAPLILAILPCAAMCALGLCMSHGHGKGGKSGTDAPGDIE